MIARTQRFLMQAAEDSHTLHIPLFNFKFIEIVLAARLILIRPSNSEKSLLRPRYKHYCTGRTSDTVNKAALRHMADINLIK